MSLTEAMHKINAAMNRAPLDDVPSAADRKAKVFISFSSADNQLAAKCADELEAAGFSSWWSGLLNGGQDFGDRIGTELETADAVVAIFSHTSVKSRWVRAEASRAFDLDKLVPVRLSSLDPGQVPHPIGTLQMVELGDTPGLVRAIETLVSHQRPGRDQG